MRKIMLLALLLWPIKDIQAGCVFASPDVVDHGLTTGGWHELSSETRKHCIWTRDKADALMKEYAATVLLDAPVELVVGILMDLKSYRHIFEYVEISDVIEKRADAGRFFQQLKFPKWMIGIKDRYFTIDQGSGYTDCQLEPGV